MLQIFFVAAGNPGLGFGLSLAGGVLNIILDYVLIAVIPLGVAGAAWATGAGYVLQTVVAFAISRSGVKAVFILSNPNLTVRLFGKRAVMV